MIALAPLCLCTHCTMAVQEYELKTLVPLNSIGSVSSCTSDLPVAQAKRQSKFSAPGITLCRNINRKNNPLFLLLKSSFYYIYLFTGGLPIVVGGQLLGLRSFLPSTMWNPGVKLLWLDLVAGVFSHWAMWTAHKNIISWDEQNSVETSHLRCLKSLSLTGPWTGVLGVDGLGNGVMLTHPYNTYDLPFTCLEKLFGGLWIVPSSFTVNLCQLRAEGTWQTASH